MDMTTVDNSFASMPVHDAGLPNRAINAIDEVGRFKTVGELAKATDEELADLPRIGKRTINQIRQRLQELVNQGANASPAEPRQRVTPTRERSPEEVEWARSHPHLVRAIMAREVVVTPRS